MGRRRRHRREEFDSLLNNEVVKHDLERLRKILGPCKDIEELEEALTWPQKAQAEQDAEWLALCNEYTKLTGGTTHMDGMEVPSMYDLCYYIGDWAIKYAEMGNTIPTMSGKTPLLPPYWAKNQVILFADNGRVCPREFKHEMDDELLFLLHSANIDDSNDPAVMKKMEVVMKVFFFAGKDLAQIFEYVCEEYEKRLRRGLLQGQSTPFCDLLFSIVELEKDLTLSRQIELVKSFVVECEAMKGRHFSWGLTNATFDLRLPSCLPPPIDICSPKNTSQNMQHIVPLRQCHKLKGMIKVFAAAFSMIMCITMLINYYVN